MRNKSKEYLDKKLRKLLLWQMKVDSIIESGKPFHIKNWRKKDA